MDDCAARYTPTVPESLNRNAVRPEIQGLRAVAVLLIVGFHFFPERVPGGYIGVDVFFVVSGYLITAHLMREVDANGRISLPAFWARRARRLLPASLLVLISVAVATFLIVPRGLWARYFSEVAASALYFQNWLLAGNSVDYLAANNSPSPTQHFWSLSAEEQFYLLWPILIVVALVLTRRSAPRGRRRMVFGILGGATLISFITSLVLTAQYPAVAYFITPTRAWEFGAGALLAFAPAVTRHPRFAFAASWAGVVLIAAAAFAFDAHTPFPGIAALAPTVGALAVIWGGSVRRTWSVTALSSWRPIQYVGDISYSVYLWHWPFVVLVPFLTLQPLSTPVKLVALAITFVLAALTKAFVEDPVRRAPVLIRRRPRWSLLGALIGMILVSALSSTGLSAGLALTNPAPPAAPYGAQCFGAAATAPMSNCPQIIPADWTIAAAFARLDNKDPGVGDEGARGCQTGSSDGSKVYECRIGHYDDPVRTVALIGDSHANQYDAALATLSRDLHWNIVVYVRSACAGTGDPNIYFTPRKWDAVNCADWGQKVTQAVVSNSAIDTVFANNYADVYFTGTATTSSDPAPIGPEPYMAMWQKFIAAGKKVVVLSDTPRPNSNIPDCIELHKAITLCSAPAGTALHPNVMKDAVGKMNSPSVTFIDFSDRFCFDGSCPPIIGGVVVYNDDSHLTKTYSASLGPFIEKALRLSPR